MLNIIAFILQHPLVVFAFLFWGIAPDWRKGHDVLHAAFVHIRTGSDTVDIDDPYESIEPVAPLAEIAHTEMLEAEPVAVTKTLRDAKHPAPPTILIGPPEVLEITTTPTDLETETTAVDTDATPFAELQSLAMKLHHHHHHQHEPWGKHCNNVAEHLGKWNKGCMKMRLHYVCKSSRRDWCHTYGWARFGNNCYHADLKKPLSYAESMSACKQFGYNTQLTDSHLVTIESEAENNFVQHLLAGQSAWIGLATMNGNWTWADGTELQEGAYVNWENASAQPSPYQKSAQAAFMNDWKVLCLPPPWLQWKLTHILIVFIVVAFAAVLVTLLITCIVKVSFMCQYKSSVTDKRHPFAEGQVHAQQLADFQHSPFGCFEDIDVCLHACCCGIVRNADTHKAAGVTEFWNVILYWVFSCVAGRILGGKYCGDFLSGIIISGLMTHKRQKLKAKLGIAPNTWCLDFLLWWCCTPCAIAQEARHVDYATGAKVRCCCSLSQQASSALHPVVGPAISLQYLNTEPSSNLQQPMARNQMPAPSSAPMAPTAPSSPQVIIAEIVHIQPPASAQVAAQPFIQTS